MSAKYARIACSTSLSVTITIRSTPASTNSSETASGRRHATPSATFVALRDNFCANVEGGAWILRQALDEAHGDLWKGVALYHSRDPVHKLEYMRLVYAQAMRLKRESARELASADFNGGGR